MKLDKALELTLAEMLLLHVRRKYGTQAAAAKAWGVSGAFVSAVLHSKKAPTKPMLDDAGIVMTVTRRVHREWQRPVFWCKCMSAEAKRLCLHKRQCTGPAVAHASTARRPQDDEAFECMDQDA